jgi:hypothetical protein
MHAKLKQIIRINKAQPLQDQVFFFWYKIRLSLLTASRYSSGAEGCVLLILIYIFSCVSMLFDRILNAGKVIKLTLY